MNDIICYHSVRMNSAHIVAILNNGGTVVIRTDTLYGIIARVDNERAVEKVYTVKQRGAHKQCIVLIDYPSSVPAHAEIIEFYSQAESQSTSVVVPASHEPSWILRGGNSVAYRLVRDPALREIIAQTGPVIAPSANPEGLPPARTIAEAKAYFGDAIDAYIDGGSVPESMQPSQIIRVHDDGTIDRLR